MTRTGRNAALRIGAVAGLWFAATDPAAAASDTALALKGLQRLEIVVEDVSENASLCGITRQGLDTSLRSVVGQSRIVLVDAVPDATLYLNVSVLSDCTARVTLEVFTGVTIAKTGQPTVATIWNDGILGRGADPVAQVDSIIGELAKGLISDWNSVNPSN